VTRELRVERDTGIFGNFTSSGTSSVGAKEQPLDQALIIFVRNLIPGKVKTRLAAEIGKEDAIHVYQQLLEHTRSISKHLPVDIYVFDSDQLPEDDIWSADPCQKRIQTGEDLGQRMSNAFQEVLKTHQNVILIGSDCVDLSHSGLQEAFMSLLYVDAIIGPSRDGGYYLIGMKTQHPVLFDGIAWSSDSVYTNTREKLIQLVLNFNVLPERMDIDTKQDLIDARIDF
jgi:rSAM/selenodomain-associated transferase 1